MMPRIWNCLCVCLIFCWFSTTHSLNYINVIFFYKITCLMVFILTQFYSQTIVSVRAQNYYFCKLSFFKTLIFFKINYVNSNFLKPNLLQCFWNTLFPFEVPNSWNHNHLNLIFLPFVSQLSLLSLYHLTLPPHLHHPNTTTTYIHLIFILVFFSFLQNSSLLSLC